MALSEFDLIAEYFSTTGRAREDVVLGVGDDCALLRVPPGVDLAATVDTLIEGVHFSPGCDPENLGHKALAVNLSDLAAMGASPAWATLALTLPAVDPDWLRSFSRGFGRLAESWGIQLVGGDTTRGNLSVTVQVHGFVDAGQALRRDGAKPGQLIGVTGSLGDAGLALLALRGEYHAGACLEDLQQRLERPLPRLEAGAALTGVASAAIDISDGLLADLGHICLRSGTGAELDLALFPLSPCVAAYVQQTGDWTLPLSAGDDYELCVSVAPERRLLAEDRVRQTGCLLTWIGETVSRSGVRCRRPDGTRLDPGARGYEHFG